MTKISHRPTLSDSSDLQLELELEDDSRDSFDFSASDHSTSDSSAGEEEEAEPSWKYQAPPAPRLSYTSPPETPVGSSFDPLAQSMPAASEAASSRAQRPAMRLDLSNLPSPFGLAARLQPRQSPRPGLSSRFSSDDSLNAPSSALTPGTESALSAFGIAAGRRSPRMPSSPLPTPPLRSRMRHWGDGDDSSPVERRRSPRPSSSPLQRLVACAADLQQPAPAPAPVHAPAPAVTSAAKTPMLDFEGARAIAHRLLPGDHRLLATGDTPGISPAHDSYFEVQA